MSGQRPIDFPLTPIFPPVIPRLTNPTNVSKSPVGCTLHGPACSTKSDTSWRAKLLSAAPREKRDVKRQVLDR